MNELDRRFDQRRAELIGTPASTDGTFEMEWRATNEKSGCPDLFIGGLEQASFEGDVIRQLEDGVEDATDTTTQLYMARHFPRRADRQASRKTDVVDDVWFAPVPPL